MTDRYRIEYLLEDEISLRSKGIKGHAEISDGVLQVSDCQTSIMIPGTEMRTIELLVRPFLAAVKIDYDDKRIYLVPLAGTVAGFSLASYALIKALFRDCVSIAPRASVVDPRKPINWKRNIAFFCITFFGTLFALGAFSYFRAQ